ncbi:hypothetical protein M9H77_19138 [Catharanthus roseus]|uniref:Uncharacterized protein n=1 Tax=Catharanthus roseus TaxID=4058 RepID=A0ACC0B9G0_CATRO|nr:hypothetical protein M9H77_19138 [Catharanthus roseus]
MDLKFCSIIAVKESTLKVDLLLSGCRGDDDLGLITDRTGKVHGCIVTASSRGRPVDRVCEGDRAFEGDKGLGEEHDRVQALRVEGEADEGGDDGGDDDQDESEDAGDEEQPMPVAHASGSNGRPHHGKGKGLTRSFMSMMSKISGSHNKRPDMAHEVPAPTQRRKKVESLAWEQIGPANGGPIDPELIPSYGGHVEGPIWRGQVHIFLLKLHDRGSLKCRLRYMALTGWDLTDAQVRSLATGTEYLLVRFIRSIYYQYIWPHSNHCNQCRVCNDNITKYVALLTVSIEDRVTPLCT